MPNVLSFPKPRTAARPSGPPIELPPIAVASGPITQVREDLRQAIFALDLAYLQAWRLVRKISDPASRQKLATHLSAIESLLEIVRDKARGI